MAVLGRVVRASVIVVVLTAAAVVARSPRLARLAQRWVRIGDVSTRTAGRSALHRLRRRTLPAERHAELDAALSLRNAQDVAGTLGDMKGAFMKVGQLFGNVNPSCSA